MSRPTPRFVGPAAPLVDPARLDRLNLETALVAALDSDPAYRAMGWPAITTAYRNALETVLQAWIDADSEEATG